MNRSKMNSIRGCFFYMHAVLCYFQFLAYELHTRHAKLFLKINNKCIFSNYVKFDECPSCSSYSKIRFMNATITNFHISLVLKLEEYILLSVYYCYNFISFKLKKHKKSKYRYQLLIIYMILLSNYIFFLRK